MDTNIFKLHSYRVFLVVFCDLFAITSYLLTTFSQFCGSINTVNVIAKYYMTECSSTVLLTHAVQPDAGDAISDIWFYVAT